MPKESSDSSRAIFKIYGDDRVLYDSGEISRKDTDRTFDIDITGVMEIKVLAEITSWGDNTEEMYLFNSEVYNTLD